MVVVDTKKLNASMARLVQSARAMSAGFPNTVRALDIAASVVSATWVKYASGDKIPNTSRTINSEEIRNGVRVARPAQLVRIIYNDSEAMDRVQSGTPRIDLKQFLPTQRSYKAKAGHYYNIVPFRHNVKDVKKAADGQQMYARMLQMSKSFVIGSRIEVQERKGGKVLQIKRATYQWGSRLREGEVQNKRQVGMVRMETSTGGARSSAYMTFRVMSQRSPAGSWVIPAKSGINLVQIVADSTKEQVSQIIEAGIKKDLALAG